MTWNALGLKIWGCNQIGDSYYLKTPKNKSVKITVDYR